MIEKIVWKIFDTLIDNNLKALCTVFLLLFVASMYCLGIGTILIVMILIYMYPIIGSILVLSAIALLIYNCKRLDKY